MKKIITLIMVAVLMISFAVVANAAIGTVVYATKVDSSKEADKFFPNLDEAEGWKLDYESEEFEHNETKFKFTTYIK